MSRQYYVYIMASRSGTLYVGVTNNLQRRVFEHKNRLVPGFTTKYNVTRLVHMQPADDPLAAIRREKQIKSWLRARKVALIEETNPAWDDLSEGWFAKGGTARPAQRDPSLRSG